MNMVYIPAAAILVMTLFIIVRFKVFLAYTQMGFKILTGLLYVGNLFFLYWGPHLSKINSTIIGWEDVWYIVLWAVVSIIIVATVLSTKANQIR